MAAAAARSSQPLDPEAFRHFAPLLEGAQGYASHSGCRFRSSSFDGIPTERPAGEQQEADALPVVDANRARDYGPRLAAKIRAAPAVREFGERLRKGDRALVEEMERAHHIVMAESVRNAMMSMFQALGVFPPTPPPRGVQEDDCAYEDMSAPLPVIAQRLYNDQARRVLDTTGGPSRLEQRAMTAAFLVDFADGVGWQLPPMSETQQGILKDIAERTSEYSKAQGGAGSGTHAKARDVFLRGLGGGAAAENLRQEAQKWWKENWQAVLWTAAGAALVGAVAVAGAALSKQQQRQRDRNSGANA